MFSIEFSKEAQNFFNKLENKEALIIAKKIDSLKDDPFRYLKRLQGEKLWRLRIGDYRAIADVIISANKIVVVRIGKRCNVYN
ncbi:MAG: type II toxin-antitoxin system RelE/ParE family toxin [Nanoarchaeota archaeon]